MTKRQTSKAKIEEQDDQFVSFLSFVSRHWGKLMTLLGIVASIFYAGYWMGEKITSIEYKIQINGLENNSSDKNYDKISDKIDDKFDEMDRKIDDRLERKEVKRLEK